MKQTITIRAGVLMVALALLFGVSCAPVFAHEGVDHSNVAEATLHESESAEIAKLEKILSLLNQLVILINALHIQQGYPSVLPPPLVADDQDEMEEHHEEHSPEPVTVAPEVKKLVIEVEEHNSKTHVHVRYVDKAEEMFFVDSVITDEDGLVGDIHERTELEEDDIREALSYM